MHVRIIKRLAVGILCFSCMCVCAYADDEAVFDFSLDSNTIKISGNMGQIKSGSKVNVKVYETRNKGAVSSIFVNTSEEAVMYDNSFYNLLQRTADLDGKYSFDEFVLEKGKKYEIDVTADFSGGSGYKQVVYSPADGEVEEFIRLVQSGSEAEIADAIKKEKIAYETDSAEKANIGVNMIYVSLLSDKYIDNLAKVLKNNVKTSYNTYDEFNDFFVKSSFLIYMSQIDGNSLLKYLDYQNNDNKKLTDKERIYAKEMLNLSEISNTSSVEKYNKMNDGEKISVCSILQNIDFMTTAEFYDAFHISVVLSEIKNAKYWTDITGIITRHSDILPGIRLDNNCYNENINKSIARLSSKSVSDFVTDVNKIIDSQPQQQEQKPQNGGGGGGGGGYTGSANQNTLSPIGQTETTGNADDGNKMPFVDIDNFKWAHNAIKRLYDDGIINGKGEGKFEPESNITRAEFLKMIMRAMKIDITDDSSEELPFRDVKDDWYREYVRTAYELNIVNGISAEEFGVNEDILRQDMAVIAYRAFKLKNVALKGDECALEDYEQTDDYAKEAVAALYTADIINGDDAKMFNPKQNLTRAEAAMVIYNILQYV